ncbi:MAG: ATP-binding protein [Candidatus Helarchaeota archaeon]
MKCKGFKSYCGKEVIVYLNYIKRGFCKEHFIEFELKRMARTIKRYNMIKATKDKIMVALSGGKDSTALLDMLVSYYNMVDKVEYRPKIEAIHINLGIDANSYSEKCLNSTTKLCDMLGVPLHIIDLKKEYGFKISDFSQNKKFINRKPCSLCGVVKRYILNKFPRDLGATKIATGHLLDDEVSTLMKNLIYGPVENLIRMSPKLESIKELNLLSRIKPLYEISEFETSNYVKLKNLPYVSDKCPNAITKTMKMKETLEHLEKNFPNSRYFLLRNFNKYYQPAIKSMYSVEIKSTTKCRNCGQPTSIDLCSFCRILEKFNSD